MVKVFYLGLFAAIICAFAVSYASAGPVPSNFRQHPLLHHQLCNGSHCQPQRFLRHSSNNQEVAYAEDGTVRSERSTNLSHITGSARKIQMFVKNWHLQILPDGVVNGTQDDSSDYTILQRTTVNIGQLKIQGVATCQYLCMDSCGLLYASKDFVDECIFNEMIEQHHYNTYSSVRYSNARKTLYIALNRYGSPRRVQIRAQQQLGKLSTYARVLTKTVSLERVEDLLTRIGNATGSHPLRHHGGLQTCTSVIDQKAHNSDWQGVDRLRCRKRKKRKKKRRRCDKQQEEGGSTEGCPINNNNKNKKKNNNNGEVVKKNLKNVKNSDKKKLCEHDNKSKKCQRLGGKSDLVTVKRKKKKQLNRNPNNKKKNNQKTLRNNNNNPNNSNNNNNNDNNNNSNSNNNNRKIVKKVLPVFQENDDNTTITSASVEETSIAEETSLMEVEVEETSVLEESSTMDESTTMTSAMEDSEQNDDDGGSVVSTTQPSAEVD